ncbi:glycosyl hydrolase family 28-related protein [Maribacter antarcticus]|uniref:glycosyl hydrolase family 28-related protein n=1 Tax=Maribacter antarcticus TaxID=505250 RepID=UPI00047AE551|nr:glycosyl hydrolase family 28-related protein [Maribacter antarcticus]
MILTIRNRIKNILGFSSIKLAAFSLLILISACNEKEESHRINQGELSNQKNNRVNEKTFTINSRTFNVLDYGAVGDDKTDNTEAFSVCMKAIIEVGGGRMYIPDGVYHGRIIIPGTKKWMTVEIVGESEPTPIFGTIGSFPYQNKGTIIKSLAESGLAVIYASNSPEKLYQTFSGINVVLRNLDVRTYDNPAISGIDLENAAQCKIEHVFINTDIYNVQASKPTHGTSGLITPACNNAALTILRDVVVTGYHTGILVNEHTDADNINLASNVNGLEFAFAHHASRFGRVGAQRCTNAVSVTGKHGFSIEQLDMEIAGAGQTDENNKWQATEYNVNDPKNLGIADINYWVVEGNVGAVDKFIKNGGASIRARRIGSVPATYISKSK